MVAKCALRIEHDRPVSPSPKHHPMPERATLLSMPFYREQRTIRQILPRGEGLFGACGPDSILLEQSSNMMCLGPQPRIACENAEPVRLTLRRPIAHISQRRHACDAASSLFKLHDRLHNHFSFYLHSPDMKYFVHLYHGATPCQARGVARLAVAA